MHPGYVTVFIVFILIGTLCWCLIEMENNQKQCNNLGGVYVESQCFKAEILELE